MARAVSRTFSSFLIGVGAAALVVMMAVIAGEEELLGFPALELALDQWGRATMGVILALVYLAALIITSSNAIRDVHTSRAVAQAVAGGASQHAVPHPTQAKLIVDDPGNAFRYFAYTNFGVGILLLIAGVVVASTSRPSTGDLLSFLVIALYLAVLALATTYLVTKVIPPHRQRRETIAAHWPPNVEKAAWERARAEGPDAAAAIAYDTRGQPARTSQRLIVAAAMSGAFAQMLMVALMLITHPDARFYPGSSHAGDRAQLPDQVEWWVNVGYVILAILVIVALAAGFLGQLVEGRAQAREQQELWNAVERNTVDRPSDFVLQRHSKRQPVRLASALAMLGGLGATAGLGVVLLASGAMEGQRLYANATSTFSGLAPLAASAVTTSLVMVLVSLLWQAWDRDRGQDLRNALMARWPVPPEAKETAAEERAAYPSLTPDS